MAEKKHQVLLIGCGSIGERHLRGLINTGRAEVTACDVTEALRERMAAVYRVKTAANWEVAIRSGSFDIAVICTPAHLHVAMALKAFEFGLHVLVEKPLSHSLKDVAELLAAHRRSGRQAAVAYNYHIYPFLSEARAFLRTGELGPVKQAVVNSGQCFPQFRPAYADTYYRDRRTGGGAIQDALTHAANWVESVIGPADSVLCDCAHLVLPGVEVEDTVHVAARHGGTLATYSLNQFQHPNETVIQFNTAQGSVRIEFQGQRWGYFRAGDKEWTWRPSPPADRDVHSQAQAAAFLDQVARLPAQLCSLEAGAQTLRFNLAALAAAEKNVRVFCGEIRP